MTIDRAELRKLAQAVADLEDQPELETEHQEAKDALWQHTHCHTILGLIDQIEGLHAQHGRDSAELRGLCQARDDCRHARDDLQKRWDSTNSAYKRRTEMYDDLCDDLNRLKVENRDLALDAERYRLIRDSQNDQFFVLDARVDDYIECLPSLVDEAMDAAIDEELAKLKT